MKKNGCANNGAALTHMEKTMQYALVNGEKCEASRGLIGVCLGCDQPMIPKCGPVKIAHWAHKTKQCDSFWEPEKPWHRGWKGLFPESWREVRQHDASGECHIADIRTEHGLVIECQHSSIGVEEMAAREKFYQSVGAMVWVVNGARYKAAQQKLSESQPRWRDTPVKGFRALPWPEKFFPKAWISCAVPVFFDFDLGKGEASQEGDGVLWCLLPGRAEGRVVFAIARRSEFVKLAHERGELFAYKDIVEVAAAEIKYAQEMERRRMQPLPAWRLAADRRRRRF